MHTEIKIDIKDIKINEEEKLFSFEYTVFKDGEEYETETYYDSYSNQTGQEIRKTLEDGYAFELVTRDLIF